MINTRVKNNTISNFNENFAENYKNNLADLDMSAIMKTGICDTVKLAVEKIKSNCVIAIPDGFQVAKTNLHVHCSGDGSGAITAISITLGSKLNAEKTFKFKGIFSGNNIVDDLAEFFRNAYEVLLLDSLAEENVREINKIIAEASEEVSYKVSVASVLGGSDSKLAFISDEEVIFNVDLDRIFEVDDILALYEPDEEYSEEDIKAARKMIADEIIKAQTTEQLVKAHGTPFIEYFANIQKNVKATTLLKKVAPKSASSLVSTSNGIGHYLEDDTFAIVAKRDGNFEVVLSPFDINTFRKVKLDVVSKLEK